MSHRTLIQMELTKPFKKNGKNLGHTGLQQVLLLSVCETRRH